VTTYVDRENGLVSREIFVDEAIYRLEQDRIFCKQWLFIGHASQIPKTGDFFASRMGEESVVMVRGKDGQAHVFLNSCRHRGMKVCRYDEGNTPVFTCPYHGWSYGLGGELIGVPRYKDAYYGELDRSQFGLLEARVCDHRGMIWATWDFTGPDFYAFMGDMLQFTCRSNSSASARAAAAPRATAPVRARSR
jgi:phenylpropionate dioxygenase-like ring-hydroxylating dioxygenase large terminal subunit